MGRMKRLSKQDEMMRRDGFVTAVEVSEATGLALSAIHRGIDEGRIPGKTVRVSEKYSHRYVDLAKFIKGGNYAASSTVEANLSRLTAVVSAAKAEKPARSVPRAPAA